MRARVSDIDEIVCAIKRGDIEWFNNHEIANINAQIEIMPFGKDEIFYKRFLDIAAEGHCPRIMEILIQEGAKVNVHDTYYEHTALHRAAKTGTAEMVNILIDAGANIDATNIDDETPLFQAISKSNIDTVKALLIAKAHKKKLAELGVHLPSPVETNVARDISVMYYRSKQTPLFSHAVSSCSTDLLIVRALIELDPDTDINKPDRFNETALEYALKRFFRSYPTDIELTFNKNLVIFLLRLGAEVKNTLSDSMAKKLSEIKAEIKREDDTLATVRNLRFDSNSFFYHTPRDIVECIIEPYVTGPSL